MPTLPAHGRRTVLKIGTLDISPWTDNSALTRAHDKAETTAYGAGGHTYSGDGLAAHTFTCSGWYDATAVTGTGPLIALEGTVVTITRQLLGTAVTKPQEVFSAFFDKYADTDPVNGIIKWSADFTVSGTINDAVQ